MIIPPLHPSIEHKADDALRDRIEAAAKDCLGDPEVAAALDAGLLKVRVRVQLEGNPPDLPGLSELTEVSGMLDLRFCNELLLRAFVTSVTLCEDGRSDKRESPT